MWILLYGAACCERFVLIGSVKCYEIFIGHYVFGLFRLRNHKSWLTVLGGVVFRLSWWLELGSPLGSSCYFYLFLSAFLFL